MIDELFRKKREREMQLTILTGDPDIKAALLSAELDAQILNQTSGSILKSDLGAKTALGFTVKTLSELPALAGQIYRAVQKFIGNKPKATFIFEALGGRVELTLENLTEEAILETLQRVFALSKQMRKAKSSEQAGDFAVQLRSPAKRQPKS